MIEATHLMRDRLLMNQVYERLGWDVPVWVKWANETPFMQGFRQMLFSKIVPNLKRLGLLTPRVRAEYAKIGLLHFEDLADSTVDPEPMAAGRADRAAREAARGRRSRPEAAPDIAPRIASPQRPMRGSRAIHAATRRRARLFAIACARRAPRALAEAHRQVG